jgi:hypothetical protein
MLIISQDTDGLFLAHHHSGQDSQLTFIAIYDTGVRRHISNLSSQIENARFNLKPECDFVSNRDR